MAIILGDNIQINGPLAVDSRYLNDLVPYTSVSGANSTIVSGVRYIGLTVNVGGVEYWYKDGIGDGDLVIKTMGGTGTLTGATNGIILTNSGTTVALGGSLISDTTIDASGNSFNLTNIKEFQVSSGLSTIFGIDNTGLIFSFSGGSIGFEDNGGLKYGGDYSSGFTAQSLANAGYVTGLTSTKLNTSTFSGYTGTTQPILDAALTGATNGLGFSNRVVSLGGNLTGDTTIDGLNMHKLSLINLTDFQISSSGGTGSTSVSLNTPEGLIYGDNYTSGNPYWIPTKIYVDSVAIGLNVHPATWVASTTDLSLSGLTTVDGVLLQNGDRVLVKSQTDDTENGIYDATGGTWQRSEDYNFSPLGEIANGDLIPVTSGVTLSNSLWAVTSPNPVVSGDSIQFTLFSRPIQYIGGTGINVALNTISVDGASLIGNSLLWSGNTFNVDIDSGTLQTALNSKLNKTTFTGYTATTSTLINSKLATTTFTGYTASTQPIIDNAITGATNFGTGTTVYSGTTGRTLNFSTIVGSGSVSVQKVGNEIVIYSSGGTGSEYVFTSDIVVSIASGKTFGKYENGETVPASGKTAVQVIQMALAEALDPTVSLSSSGDNVVFGASGKTVNLTFSYTINTYGASVASALVEWRRGGTGAWSALTTTTGTPSGYTHNIDDSANRFNTAVLNYRYTVVDTAAATGQTTYDVVPQAYAVPTYSPSYVGSLLGYETQQLREKGNTGTTISGGISSNRSLVCIKGYTIQRCVNGGGWSTVDSCAGLCSLTPSIASCLDTGAAGTATSIGYRVAVCDDWCSVTPNCSSTYTINYRYASYYGYCTSASISGAQIVALGNAALCSSRARTMVLTATGGNYTYLSYPESYGYLTSAIMDGAAPVLGAFNCSGSNSVTNAYGQTCNYILYKSNATDAFSANSVAFS